MKKVIKLLVIIFFLSSCFNQSSGEIISDDIIHDSISDVKEDYFIVQDSIKGISAHDNTILEFPLIIDSTFIESHKIDMDSSNLKGEDVLRMSEKMIDKKGEPKICYIIQDFIKIDSLKKNGEYENYVQTLDVAMIKNINANELGIMTINNGSSIKIWSSTYTSYEACPFYYGTKIYATYYEGNHPINTVLVGEVSNGGDAPYWEDTRLESIINSNLIKINWVQQTGGENDENDQEIIETSSEKYEFIITKKSFVSVGQPKD